MKVLLVVLLFAAVTYLAIRWLQDRGHGGTPAPRKPPRPPSRPVAPDDDPTFLRDLEWKRRQAERHRDHPPPPAPETNPEDSAGTSAPEQSEAPAPERPDAQADKPSDNRKGNQPDGQ